jgi:hypothetical protein
MMTLIFVRNSSHVSLTNTPLVKASPRRSTIVKMTCDLLRMRPDPEASGTLLSISVTNENPRKRRRRPRGRSLSPFGRCDKKLDTTRDRFHP